MIEVKWKDYPQPPYPPFKDPDDWRELVGGPPLVKDEQRIRQIAEDKLLDHYGRHDKRDHPWCGDCEKRRYDFEEVVDGGEPLMHPQDAKSALRDAVEPEDWEQVKVAVGRIKTFFDDGFGRIKPEERQVMAEDLGLSIEVVDAAIQAVMRIDRWEREQIRAEETVLSRISRYLLIHRGTVPVDSYDPETDVDDGDDDEYLDRDQLHELPVPEPLIDGVLTRHAYGLLTGRDHTFKSFTALDWALCLATGKPWQTKPVQHGRVLYVAGEGAYGIAKRVDAWEYAWGRKVEPGRFVVRRSAVNLYRGGPPLERLLERIAEDRYDLVILDTLRRVSGGAEGNGSDMGTVVDNIDRIKRATADGTVLVIAHTDKGDNDARGFSGIEDDADTVWHAKADGVELTLRNTKQKDQPAHQDMALQMLPVLDSLVIGAGDPYAGPVTTESEGVLMVTMREQFSETGATSTELLDASGVPRSTYYRARNSALRSGLLLNVGTKTRPRYELPATSSPTGPQRSDLQVSHDENQVGLTVPPVPPSPTGPQRSDLQVSHESHEVPCNGEKGPTRPTTFREWDVGLRGTRADETIERTAS